MCGIAGVVHNDGVPIDRNALRQMVGAMIHRGPDGEGFYFSEDAHSTAVGPTVALGHRRLAIIDVAGGRQPMTNEDGSVWVVLNGEIYNYIELREQLEARGHHFVSNSDTEVIVHQYEEEGIECVRAFRGMFAFAVWDDRAKRLLLARDRLGKKPLWYAANSQWLLFASELTALMANPWVERTVDPQAIDAYLMYGYVPSPRSIFTGVSKVMPAHRVVWDQGGMRAERYWQLRYEPKQPISEGEAKKRFLELFREAVRIRLRSDVPVGAFLSGGLDSSSVVALMSQLSARPIQTFSIGFDDTDCSELTYARQIAQAFGTDHHEFIVTPEATAVIPQLVMHYGEPYADSSCLPTFYLAQQTRHFVTVALSGDGGDESFAGYPRYLGAAWSQALAQLPDGAKQALLWLVRRFGADTGDRPTTSVLHRASRLLQAVMTYPTIEERYLQWVGFFMPRELTASYSPDFHAQLRGIRSEQFLFSLYQHTPAASIIERLMGVDVASYLPEDLLVKMDIVSMRHALEVRSPLLDHPLMEFVASLPLRYKIRGTTSKYLLRQAMTGILPRAILGRSKMGFGVPLGRWFRRELNGWMRDILLDARSLRRGIFQPKAIERLIDEHTRGLHDHRYRLWALIMLELWYQTVLESRPVPSTAATAAPVLL